MHMIILNSASLYLFQTRFFRVFYVLHVKVWWIINLHNCGTKKYSRYHYNVAEARLHQHIEKGNEDGLFISSVASAANLWALIMDAGTGFTSQVYELSPIFLHKVY